ncbi:LysM peptidoglycan-binding domain-containing M23 family metallopeptidase [Streptomyces sp. NPDC004609]|uniref:LysM peptidoglycan-binding domain-containing M23 family metallopeptidase n=1 Tax=Streptomyces sp. NPDC004609 TaxID=3364704 RepID=UPI0036B8972C
MPKKGKHRRITSSPLTRGFVAAGTGGAAIALPLMGASGAHAAEQSAPVTAASAAVPAQAAAVPAAQQPAAPVTYRVVAGDYLSKIAADHHLSGGWQKLYADNREAVGDNPSLIHPGLELTLGAKAKAKGDAPAKAETRSEPRASRDDARESAPAPAARTEAAPDTSASAGSVEATGDDAAQSAPEQSAPQAGGGYTAPVASANISTPYRASGSMWSSGYHTGVDFTASTGTSIRSVGPGTVVSAGWSGSYGNEVVIKHTDGTYSQYAHLSSLSVSSGQSVSGGQQIGLAGSTGNSTGPHLHFEVRTGPGYGSDIDPVAYLRQHGVSL